MLSELEQYQNELLALVAILILLVLYVIIKRKRSTKEQTDNKEELLSEDKKELKTLKLEDESPLEEPTTKESNQDSIETPSQETPHKSENEFLVSGSEEGDFGVVESTPKKEKVKKEKVRAITKREVPPHDKISKEDFTEFAGKRILLAEDNIINQKVIKGLLADSGIEIVVADDGQIALDILEKDDDFLMVLMDAHMPRVDGFEATRAIRANPKYDHIVVVALSGDTAADDIKKMSEAGMAEHLEKPLKMDALYDILYAYSGEDESQDDDEEYVEVVITKSLDGEKGLAICGGDAEFYSDILKEFINSYEDSAEKLVEMLQKNDVANADKLLLDIIGVSANIGAESLHKTASTLKEALTSHDKSNISSLLKKYKKQLTELITDIKEYL